MVWLRDIIQFLFTGSFIITFIINKFYTGGFIVAYVILGVMWFASIIDFFVYIKKNKFTPLKDIKREIAISKKLRNQKKEEKKNITPEEF